MKVKYIKFNIYQVDTGYACFGIVCKNGLVSEVPPIARWAKGWREEHIVDYWSRRGSKIRRVKCPCREIS